MVRVNGCDVDANGRKLTEFLSENEYGIDMVAIERNGEILSKSEYDKVILSDGDVFEIVRFVGGG